MNKTIFSIAFVMIMVFLNCHASGQDNDSFRMENIGDTICLHRIVLDSIYYESVLVYNTQNKRISGLAVDAAIELFDYDSYVRLILVDEDTDTEYLVFDAYYPKNKIDTMFNIRQFAHETSSLFNITTSHLKIEVSNAVCAIENIYYSDKYNTKTPEQFYADRLLNKTIQDSIILECINHRISQENKIWVAGNTSLLQMTYDQRKDILPKNENNETPNLQGFEYYIGGVFDLQPYDLNYRERSSYVDVFDWRDRHGQDWTTVAKDQSTCTSCWAFAPISAAENVINLYYNRHLDYDLSEQQLLSCSNAGNCQTGGDMPIAINYLLNNGVVSENCFTYVNSNVPCNNICSNPNEHITFSNALSVNIGTDNIKQAIINSGSVCINIYNIWHYMAILGFKLLKIGDVVYNGTGTILPYTTITIGPNSPYIGQNCWLFKNSWGSEWGDNGFGYVITRSDNLFQAYKLVNPISDTLSNQDILCRDQDGDGYYNWGIGPKPSTCPNCPDEPDCDDSNPTLGPYDAQYGCTSFCESDYTNTPLYINESTTWNTPKQINRDIEILNGATLNICNTTIWELSSECSIIIHPGGKLILDGATITNPCGIMWQGIEVWGNSNTHQYLINGSYGQGYIELKNGAVIENAKCAVELWRPGYWSTTGGIIIATDAIFRNNAMAVRAQSYTNISPYTNHEAYYRANFNNCNFVVDGDYLGTERFIKHVVLTEVNGVEFKGCDFSADRSVSGVDPWCIGISSYDAGFTVTSPCTVNFDPCPEAYMNRSTFEGLCAGIEASGAGNNPRTFVVRDAVFNNNDYGINVLNSNFPTIIFNEFKIGGGYCGFNYGVCLRNSTSFCIEENYFHPTPNTTKSTVGVAVCNSNSINNVYRNTFDGLSVANLALGQNTEISNGMSAGRLQGLTYTCNEFDGNGYDIMALKEEGVGDIQFQQGSPATPAGNTFENSTFQIYNDGINLISYYYNPNGLNETPSTTMLYRVTPQSTNVSNSCNSHYGDDPIVRSPSEKAELASQYLSAYNAYTYLRRLYESHVDDSDTEDPTADNSPTAEMLQIGAQMAQYSHEYTLAAGDIVRSNLNDSVANPTELRTWLGNMHDIAADRMIVSSYIQEGDSASAFALANTLPALYDLQGDQLTDHGGYMRLISLYQALHRSGRNIFQLTETETNMVRDMAENGVGVSQTMAEALMEQITGRGREACFIPELPNVGDGDKGIMKHSSLNESREKVLNISVAPNPATTWTTINYILPKRSTKALLTLTNALGVNVLSMELEGAQGSKVLDLRDLAAGVYVYTIRYEQFTEIGKLVITK